MKKEKISKLNLKPEYPFKQTAEFNNLKFIEKAKQGVSIGVFKGAEFKNDRYFVLIPLLHCGFA